RQDGRHKSFDIARRQDGRNGLFASFISSACDRCRHSVMAIASNEPPRAFAAKLGLFDAVMIVISGIIGTGIFVNPYVVAQSVRTPFLILGAWIAGGAVALAGAFVFAELGTVLPRVGGQYAFFREAFHPLVAFLHGWALLLIIQSAATATVAVMLGPYAVRLVDLGATWA